MKSIIQSFASYKGGLFNLEKVLISGWVLNVRIQFKQISKCPTKIVIISNDEHNYAKFIYIGNNYW